eukprot:Opistho-1_new@11530
MRLAERMIGHAWQQMVKRMEAQPHRRPDVGQEAAGHVDAIEILRGHRQRLAVILPQMRDQSTDLVEDRGSRNDAQEDRKCLERDHAGRDQRDQRDRPQARADFLPAPLLGKLTLGRATLIGGVDLQPRITADDQLAQPGRQHRQRSEHTEAKQQSDRHQYRDQQEYRQRPRLHQRKRKIFRVLHRAVFGAAVMNGVDALVHERGQHHRNAEQCVPGDAEAGQQRMLEVRDLMDEQAGAIECDHRKHATGDRPAGRGQQDCAGKRGIADRRRTEEIAPVDQRVRRLQVARQFRRRAQHRAVVSDAGQANLRALCRRAGVGRIKGKRIHGLGHWHQIVAIAWHFIGLFARLRVAIDLAGAMRDRFDRHQP